MPALMKHALQQVGVGVADGTVLDDIAATLTEEDRMMPEEYGAELHELPDG